jgi:hypothetical protein
MGRVVPASVGWALWGKPEGSSDDFRLLGFSSGLMSSQAFEQVLTRFSPGTPPERAGLSGSLPWIMVGGIRIAKQPYLSLAIRERTDLLDGAGRAAPQTRYFCVSYADLRGAPVCYADLLDEVSRQPALPVGSHPAFTLDLPCLAPEAAVTAMESRKFTEAAVSGTAALLLSGPVAIVGADNSVSARERLDFIDAVAALLPFGFRTGFTAATWSNSSNHPFRLAFADSPRQDAVVVRWRADPPPPPPGA